MDENLSPPPPQGLPAAVLWDMDGTLIDTEPYWIRAEMDLCARHGTVWTRADGIAIVGFPLTVSAEAIQAKGVDLEVPVIVDTLLTQVTASVREHMPWQEDAKRLLDRMVGYGVPCGLVTMSYGILANALVERADVFAAIVTGENVANGKPHPEPYLTAATLLGVPIEQCLAIEDSPSGIHSAHSSGARAVGVKRLSELDALPGLSRVESLDSLDDRTIAAIMVGAVIDELGDAG